MLDIGTGTGTLAFLAAESGATVDGIDGSDKMLAVAKSKKPKHAFKDRIAFDHRPIYDLDLIDQACDVVTASLVLSELNDDERRYVIKHAYRLLKPGGTLIIADEIKPENFLNGFLYNLVRIPMAIVTFLVTQQSTHPINGIDSMVRKQGFAISSMERRSAETFLLLCARKP